MVRPVSRKQEGSAVKTVAKVLDILEHLGAVGRPVYGIRGRHDDRHQCEHGASPAADAGAPPLRRAESGNPRLYAGPATVRARQRLCQKHGSRRHFPAVHRAVARRDGRDGSSGDPQRPRSRGGLHRHRQPDGHGIARYGTARSRHPAPRRARSCSPSCPRPNWIIFLRAARCRPRRRKSITEPKTVCSPNWRACGRTGFALDEQELSEDVCCVGAPIRNGPDRVIAAISVAMPKVRFRQDKVPEWTRLLVETAGRISSVIRLSRAG